jgi:multiple sugar transport system permease protein
MAGSMVIMAPIVTLFLFLQRYFVQGLATVGLK